MKNANQTDVRFSAIRQGQTAAQSAEASAADGQMSDAELLSVVGGAYTPPYFPVPRPPRTPNPM